MLRSQNPFACWAVSRGLQTHSPRPDQSGWTSSSRWEFLNSSTAYSEFSHTLKFITTPLRNVLQNQHQPVKEKSQLAVLAARYPSSCTDQSGMDWMRAFQIYTQFFESFMKRSSQEIADLITRSDVVNFRRLSIQSIMDNDESFRNIGRQWNELCLVVQEPAIVDQHLAMKALEVTKVGWYNTNCIYMKLTAPASAYLTEFSFFACFASGPAHIRLRRDHSAGTLPTHSRRR